MPVGTYPPSVQEKRKEVVSTSTANTNNGQSDALTELLRRESGNNMYAVNQSSGACGLGQSLPCSKMLNWLGKTSLSETTYEEQLSWMMYYIQNRYGTAENALIHHDQFGWY